MADVYQQRKKVGNLLRERMREFDLTAVDLGRELFENWNVTSRTAADIVRAFSKGYSVTRFLRAEAEERGDCAYTRHDTQRLRDIFRYLHKLE